MPTAKDQLPGGANALARRVQDLERQVTELRAAPRLTSATVGTIRTAASGARVEMDQAAQALTVYDAAETVLAQMAPDTAGEGGGLWTRGTQSPYNLSAFVGGGEIRFRPVDDGVIDADAIALYDTDGKTYADLLLSSGAVYAADKRARILLESVAGGTPAVYVTGDGTNLCDLDVDGVHTAGNLAWGSVSLTPTSVNVPISTTVNGLNVRGSTFVAFASAVTALPGSTTSNNGVTGVSTNNISSTGLTVWMTRQSLTTTTVNWMLIGL